MQVVALTLVEKRQEIAADKSDGLKIVKAVISGSNQNDHHKQHTSVQSLRTFALCNFSNHLSKTEYIRPP
jgi:hypothetical protein